MRIVQVITELRPAGAERIVATLCAGLKSAGHRVGVISLAPIPEDSPIVKELRALAIPVESLGLTKTAPWRVFAFRRSLERLGGADIVHSHLIHANLVARLNRRESDAYALINTVHIAERRPDRWWHFALDRWTLSRADVQTVVSRAARDYHAARVGVPLETFPVIYNGIAVPSPVSPERQAERRRAWGVDNATRVIGMAGRLNPQKGFDIFLKALPAVAAKIPAGERWAVVILGDGPRREELEALARNAPPNLPVKLAGFVSDAVSDMAAFDLFVMPSRYEGFGLTLAEAMGHGLPALASDIDSLPELVEGYPNGQVLRFAEDNAAEIADAIAEFIDKPRVAPDTRFSVSVMTAAYLALYERYAKK